MGVEVQPVRSARDRRAFIELPYRLHSTSAQWVPPLRIEQRMYLSPRLNPFFADADVQLFLARRDGRVVGRLSAQVDRVFNQHSGKAWGSWGFLDVEEDAEALGALLDAAARWLGDRGMERMVGPMSFTMNDGAGVLVEGFEHRAMIRQTWNEPWLPGLLEDAGLVKAMDLLMWNLEVQDRGAVLPIVWELADKVEAEHGIRVRKMTRRSLRRDLDAFAEVYNEAWSENWGFRPYTKADLDHYAQELQLVFDPHWFMVAETADGEVAAVAITVPDVNQVLQPLGGRLLPLGWVRYLRRQRHMDRVRVGFLGVRPKFQHTGVAARLYREHFDMAASTPQTGGEMGWILESNEAMNRGMEAMGGRIVKRYRMYERPLRSAGP